MSISISLLKKFPNKNDYEPDMINSYSEILNLIQKKKTNENILFNNIIKP